MIRWKIIHAESLPGFRLDLKFADGTTGIVDLSGERFDNVLKPLADPAFFAKVTVEHGTVVWPGGLDLAPDALYEDVKECAMIR